MQLFRKILFPFSLLYMLVVYTRNFLYDIGFFKSTSFKTPIICVGNVSVGGTGKTPMVEFLIDMLDGNFKTAMLSRGYKRASKGFVLANSESKVEELGDEPYQIWKKFAAINLAVDADRRNGIALLEQKVQPDVIILDDAFQHRKVKSGFSILLTSYEELYVDDWYLPTGNLRDSKREAKRADVIVVTKCPKSLDKEEQQIITLKLKPKPNQKVLFACIDYNEKVLGENNIVFLDYFKDKSVTVVTGIANPLPFVDFLKKQDIALEHMSFSDHHNFSEQEIEKLNKKEIILTTEKDYVRLKNKIKAELYYIPIKHKFLGEGADVLKALVFNFMKLNS